MAGSSTLPPTADTHGSDDAPKGSIRFAPLGTLSPHMLLSSCLGFSNLMGIRKQSRSDDSLGP